MSSLTKLARLLPGALSFQKAAVPALLIQGQINFETTLFVTTMLEKIPKNKDKIALIINSQGGCYAQTHIIAKKIAQIAKRNKAQVWTFAQEWALNAGFLLLSTGNRVFIDKTSVVGGTEVGQSKLLHGKFEDYISTVTYAREPTYLSEINSSGPIDAAKKLEIEGIYARFSHEIEGQIRKLRGNKIADGVDLKNFFVGQDAVKVGLADALDRYHSAYGKLSLNSDVRLLEKSPIQNVLEKIRRLNISD